MSRNKDTKEWVLSFVLASVAIACVSFALYTKGYKQGQIDYSLGRVTYTVIEGKIIHIEGDAPDKEIDAHLSPIEEGVK